MEHNRPLNNMMDVTFVLEESGVTATVEVPCEADVAAAKEVACTALAVSPASVEMRIGTQVLEGTCRLQDTAFDAGVQVVLARPRFADIKCPAEYSVQEGASTVVAVALWHALSSIVMVRMLVASTQKPSTLPSLLVWEVTVVFAVYRLPSHSARHTATWRVREELRKVALPGGEVLRKVDGTLGRQCSRVTVLLSRREMTASLCMTKT